MCRRVKNDIKLRYKLVCWLDTLFYPSLRTSYVRGDFYDIFRKAPNPIRTRQLLDGSHRTEEFYDGKWIERRWL